MHLHEFINLTYNFDSLWNFLCEKKVVRNEITCLRCQNVLVLVNSSKNRLFHCTKSYYKVIKGRKRQRVTCNFKVSAFHGTWFERTHMDLVKICRFIAYFLLLQPPRHRCLINELELNDRAVVDWTNFCRKLLQQWIVSKQEPIGGPGKIIEIDGAKIGKRKYNRGRIIQGQWVFGGIERNTKKVFILPVPNRSTEILLPIIRKYVIAGSIIHTDKWRACDALQNENYIHRTVNHSAKFIDPETAVHTRNIERLWRDMQASIPRYGTRDNHFMNYLAEFLFKRIHNFDKRIEAFFEIMSSIYPLDRLNTD